MRATIFIDGDKVITTFDGDPIFNMPEVDPQTGQRNTQRRPVTVGEMIGIALLASDPADQRNQARQLNDFELAQKFHKPVLPVQITEAECERIRHMLTLLPNFTKFVIASVLAELRDARLRAKEGYDGAEADDEDEAEPATPKRKGKTAAGGRRRHNGAATA